MNTKNQIIGFLLLLFGCTATPIRHPCIHAPVPLSESRAFRILETAPQVWPDGWGIAGAPSCYSAAYRIIAASPQAEERFKDLYRLGTPAAKLYALAGLRQTNRAVFEKYRNSEFAKSTAQIGTYYGCIRDEQAIADFVSRIADGKLSEFGGPPNSP